MITLYHGDCLDHLRTRADNSVDAVVTDPPYGLSAPPDIAVVLAAWMAGKRYHHKGGGFMSAAWDSFVPGPQVWREVFRVLKPGGHAVVFAGTRTVDLMGISVRLAGFEVRDIIHWCYWSGFPKSLAIGPGQGTAVKPAIEPALLLRKPISETSIARNVLKWGTGSLNIDACRFAPGDPMWPTHTQGNVRGLTFAPGRATASGAQGDSHALGRFPANLVHVPKASRAERELGCEGLPTKTGAEATGSKEGQARLDSPRTGAGRSADAIRNFHPTVKPLGLMRWLVRLVTPPGGVVLDPFMGSGTTGMAVVGQGYGGFIGCELVAEHLQIARARIEYAATGQAVDCDLADSRTPPTQPSMF